VRISRALVASLLAVALLVTGLARVGQLARTVWVYYRQAQWEDEVSRIERGFAPVRRHLAGYHRVGYASAIPNDRLMGLGYADQTWRYFLAQYAVAPVIVSRRPGVFPLLADFETVAALDDFARTHGYAIRWRQGGFGLLDRRPAG
jgi:hypothetical protein